MFITSLTYDDITFVPREASTVVSRSQPDTTINIRNKTKLKVPLTAAPMIHVCESDMCAAMAKFGGVGFIHRFNSVLIQQYELKRAMNLILKSSIEDQYYNFGVSINITNDYIHRLDKLVDMFESLKGTSGKIKLWVLLDTANGFSTLIRDAMLNVIKYFKEKQFDMNDYIFVAGNVASGEGYHYIAEESDYLFDIVRVGISNGSVCTTGIVTGVGQGIVSTIMECDRVRNSMSGDAPLIMADGGIRSSGDVAKALAVGADLAMAGGLLAGFDESPGEFHVDTEDFIDWVKGLYGKSIGQYEMRVQDADESLVDDYVDWLKKNKPSKLYKKFIGMASHEAAIVNNNINEINKPIITEGESHYVIYKGSVYDYIPAFVGGLRSSMSYMNAMTIDEFKEAFYRNKNSIVQLTYFGHIERQPYIKNNGINI